MDQEEPTVSAPTFFESTCQLVGNTLLLLLRCLIDYAVYMVCDKLFVGPQVRSATSVKELNTAGRVFCLILSLTSIVLYQFYTPWLLWLMTVITLIITLRTNVSVQHFMTAAKLVLQRVSDVLGLVTTIVINVLYLTVVAANWVWSAGCWVYERTRGVYKSHRSTTSLDYRRSVMGASSRSRRRPIESTRWASFSDDSVQETDTRTARKSTIVGASIRSRKTAGGGVAVLPVDHPLNETPIFDNLSPLATVSPIVAGDRAQFFCESSQPSSSMEPAYRVIPQHQQQQQQSSFASRRPLQPRNGDGGDLMGKIISPRHITDSRDSGNGVSRYDSMCSPDAMSPPKTTSTPLMNRHANNFDMDIDNPMMRS